MSRGTLSIGANETTCLYLLPEVLGAFKKAHPQVQIDITRGISRTITERVINGTLNLGIVTMPVTDSRLEARTIHEDELTLVVGPAHRLASRRSVKMKELEDEPFILHRVGTTTRERLMRHFIDGGVNIKVTMELASIETIKRFVSIGLGISIVPRLCIERELQDGALRSIAIQKARFKRRLGLIFNPSRHQSRAARAFSDLF